MEQRASSQGAGNGLGGGTKSTTTGHYLASLGYRTDRRSRYRPAALHDNCSLMLDRLAGRYRSLRTLQTPALIATGILVPVTLGVNAFAPIWLAYVLWLWSGLCVLAAIGHCLPPAFAAPDLYCKVAHSIDPLEPASEADQQVLSMTRFAWMAAGAYVLVANDLVRDARLRFYDAAPPSRPIPACNQPLPRPAPRPTATGSTSRCSSSAQPSHSASDGGCTRWTVSPTLTAQRCRPGRDAGSAGTSS